MTPPERTPESPPRLDRSAPPAPGPLRPFRFPAIERATLSNGVPVLVAPERRLPVVTASVLLPAGGIHERAERAGLARLTASLLESGAGSRSAVEIAEAVETLGVQLDVSASWDVSEVGFTSLASRASAATEILADLVRRPSFPEDETERLRAEQIAGILQHRAEPRSLANEMFARHVFSERSPFSRALSGDPETVEALGRSDAADFHGARYTAAGAHVVVAGDIAVDEAVRLAEERFGDWPAVAGPPSRPEVSARELSVRVLLVPRPGAVQSEVRVGHIGVARSTPDYFPLLVMNTVLGGAFSSRLNLNLRERHGFTYGVSSAYVMRREPGPFLVSTAVQTEVTAQAVSEILHEIRRIREETVTARELDDARSFLAGAFPLPLQTTQGLASRLAELAVHDLPLDYFEDYRERVLDVSADAVLRAARAHLRPDELTVLVVGDAEQVRAPLEELGLGPVGVAQP